MSVLASDMLKFIGRLNIRSVYINFRKLPLKQAIHLPILVSRRCCINSLSGIIKITGTVRPGLIQIGYGNVDVFDKQYSRSVLDIKGTVLFQGKTRIGQGAKISVGKLGRLYFGENFQISAESLVICHKQIEFGNSVLLSWGIQILDTDFHKICKRGVIINSPDSIKIKDKVWLGMNVIILKGSVIESNSVVAAGTIVTKSNVIDGNGVFGGVPLRKLKSGTTWDE